MPQKGALNKQHSWLSLQQLLLRRNVYATVTALLCCREAPCNSECQACRKRSAMGDSLIGLEKVTFLGQKDGIMA